MAFRYYFPHKPNVFHTEDLIFTNVFLCEYLVVHSGQNIHDMAFFKVSFCLEIVLFTFFGICLLYSYLVTTNLSFIDNTHKPHYAPANFCCKCVRSTVFTWNNVNSLELINIIPSKDNGPYAFTTKQIIWSRMLSRWFHCHNLERYCSWEFKPTIWLGYTATWNFEYLYQCWFLFVTSPVSFLIVAETFLSFAPVVHMFSQSYQS